VGDSTTLTTDISNPERAEFNGSRCQLVEFVETIKVRAHVSLSLTNHHSVFTSENELLEICNTFYTKVLEKDIEWYQQNNVDPQLLN